MRHGTLLIIFAASLIPGMLLNIAVAWTLRYAAVYCASEQSDVRVGGEAAAAEAWLGSVPTHWPPADGYREWRWFGCRMRAAVHGPFIQRDCTESGWPIPSLRCDHTFPADNAAFMLRPGQVSVIDGAILYHAANGKGILDFPLRPMVPGFAAGSVFYAVFLAAGTALSQRLRRTLRRRRNLCLHCGYDLTRLISAICPECGHAT